MNPLTKTKMYRLSICSNFIFEQVHDTIFNSLVKISQVGHKPSQRPLNDSTGSKQPNFKH